MSIRPLVDRRVGSKSLSLEHSDSLHTDKLSTPPWTPPTSISGSPVVDIEGVATFPGLQNLDSAQGNFSIKLPSLAEFDQDVQALIRAHGPMETSTPPSVTHGRSTEGSASPRRCPFSTGCSPYPGKGLCGRPDARFGNDDSTSSRQGLLGSSYYPSPPPERKIRHINQKYTSKERDFIIALRERNMKWGCIKQEFAARFGNAPERTIQGLQAFYYRTNRPIFGGPGSRAML